MIKFNFVFISVFTTFFAVHALESSTCQQIKPLLKEGDILPQIIDEYLYKRVAVISDGVIGHVGMALKNQSGDWVVAESTVPKSKITPLCEYIKGGYQEKIAVRRWPGGLTNQQIKELYHESSKRMGIEYDFSFDLNNQQTQYCSKFVYEIYKEVAGIEIGDIQTFQELLNNLKTKSYFWSEYLFWKFWFVGKIPYDQETVTPQSQYIDTKLKTVFDNIRSKGMPHRD